MTHPVESLCDVESASKEGGSLSALCEQFKWSVPRDLNVAQLVCNRHADGSNRLALIAETEQGNPTQYTFDQLHAAASRLANVMLEAGVQPGDRVAVVLPQRVETALVHIAAQRIGAVSLPLSVLFGDDALQYRLQDSGTSFLVVAEERFGVIDGILNSLLRCIMSAGETVGEALFTWGKEVLNVPINEMCGQTEHNYFMGNCSALTPVKPGSMGRAYPGHRVAIMSPDGTLLPDGETGEIVVHKDDPVHFLGYWKKPEATAKKYTGNWFHTGDVGHIDGDGYIWFQGRADDVISSAGYRIGPGEIENCALTHDAVLQVAAIGVPDPEGGLRSDVVKLCVVLREGLVPDEELRRSLQSHIKEHLAAYEYPRIIEFYDNLPMTTTGKVQRNVLRQWHQDL